MSVPRVEVVAVTLSPGGVVSLTQPHTDVSVRIIAAQVKCAPLEHSFEINLCAFLVDDLGRVLSDESFVFWNNPRSPGGGVTLEASDEPSNSEMVVIDPAALPDTCDGVVLVVCGELGDETGRAFAPESQPTLGVWTVNERDDIVGTFVYELPMTEPTHPAMKVAAIFLQRGAWKMRALSASHEAGLAEIAVNLGVNLE